jgi:predicted NBD/HSP70 family sugar kinase
VAAGLASEESAARLGNPGRPSPVVRLKPDSAVVLALEIAVDSLAAAIVGLGGSVLAQVRVDRARGQSPVDDVVTELGRLAAGLQASCPAADHLIGVGTAVAAVVRREDGVVAMAPNLGWQDVSLGSRLARSLATDVPIAVGNEADLGVLAEHRRGAAVGVDDVVYISGEVGVGGGIVLGGRPLTGSVGYGGEIGHMPVNPEGSLCGCGSVGCWETEVGERALLALAGRSPASGRAGVDAVVGDAMAGSPAALAALDHVGRWLGIGIAGLVNVFNPRLVVLGGMLGRLHPHLREPLDAEVARRALPPSRALVRIVPATLGVDAPLLGAAELALEPLLANPAAWVDQMTGSTPRGSA